MTIYCGDIGEGQREIELEPIEAPTDVPVVEPATPVEVPEREPVPA